HTDFAHLSADQGSMAGSATECCENAFGHLHTADILRTGFTADQDDPPFEITFAVLDNPVLGILGMELNAARGGAWARVDTFRQKVAFLDRLPFRALIEERL